MLGDGNPNSGTKGSYFRYQYGVLKLLESINAAVAVLGPDNETRTTRYEVIAGPTPPGVGYSIGDFLVRYDVIDTTTSTIISTIWFNQTTQTTLVGAGNPNPVDIVPVSSSLSVTVLNPFNLEATQLLVKGVLDAIKLDTANLDVALSTRASEATLLLANTLLGSILAQLDVDLSTRASEATLGTVNTNLGSINTNIQLSNIELANILTALTTIDAVLDAIKVDTGNMLTSLATEATLLDVETAIDAVKLDTGAMVVDLAAIEVEQLNQGITLDSILADTDSLDTKLLQQVFDFGTSAAAIRVAAVLGNEIDVADFGIGAPGAQTLRVVIADPDTTTPQAIGSTLNPAGAGSVAAGASSVGFTTDLLFTGSINGVARNSSTFYGFEAAPGKTLPAIPWVVGAGTVTIDVIA